MSNIHRLSDLPPQREVRSQSGRSFNNEPGLSLRFIDLFFPGITWKHSIIWISLVQFIVYVATCIVGSYALSPYVTTLIKFQASVPSLVKEGQVWRILISLFLHASIWHIVFNIIFQLRLSLSCEAKYGRILNFMIYFVSGMLGNIFSAAIRSSCVVAVGASTSGFGLIGAQLAELILFWHTLQNKEQVVINILLFGILMILITWGNPSSAIDHWGHIGGFVSGTCLGIICNYRSDLKPKWYQAAFGVSITLISCTLIGPIIRIWAFELTPCVVFPEKLMNP
ncbi:rhomboid protease 3 [Cryptosporidium ubiquitum]|uniref:Rhomboid-like protease n=1 Tax=Cryptosporidium ubiquitum TaxID=857276 RepID=A0A1J4M9U2_9CRYT|nr:rhomboid protease 3 [Cryptosporidium ubiquitum]OII70767.1 rhomboid protease 3 [Cryptosporidium ubiquitum]